MICISDGRADDRDDAVPLAVSEVLRLNQYLILYRPYKFSNMDKESLVATLKLGEKELEALSHEEIAGRVAESLASAEINIAADDCGGGDIARSIAVVAEWVGLNPVETAVLRLAIFAQQCTVLQELLRTVNLGSLRSGIRALSHVLCVGIPALTAALEPKATLCRSGLLTAFGGRAARIADLEDLVLVRDGLAELMNRPDFTIEMLLHDIATELVPATLVADDFSYISADIELLTRYLRVAREQQREGVNILLVGEPGTGKTELCSVLTHAAGLRSMAVAHTDRRGEPVHGNDRRAAYQMLQWLGRRASVDLLVVDEAEDLFDLMDSNNQAFGATVGRNATGTRNKAWWNNLFETNVLPALWVSNSIRSVDAAYLRRFDYVLEMPQPNEEQRVSILSRCFSGSPISKQAIKDFSRSKAISPGNASRAINVVSALANDVSSAAVMDADAILRLILNRKLEAAGDKPVEVAKLATSNFRPEWLHTSINVQRVAEMLARRKEGRMLFYGQPGTGKSAFARYLAEQLDCELVMKRASDILDMWLGGTEKNLAEAFGSVKDGGLLLIDEIDSLLQSRAGAEKQWQVTQVNELLTQLESFTGMVAFTTNRIEHLDPAALRRFDLKVEFLAMKPDQLCSLVERALQNGGVKVTPEIRREIRRLPPLCHGDVAVVQRTHSLFGENWTAGEWLSRLQAEANLKPANASRFKGFVSTNNCEVQLGQNTLPVSSRLQSCLM